MAALAISSARASGTLGCIRDNILILIRKLMITGRQDQLDPVMRQDPPAHLSALLKYPNSTSGKAFFNVATIWLMPMAGPPALGMDLR